MIEFDISKSGFSKADIEKEAKKLSPYIDEIINSLADRSYAHHESFINLPDDIKNLKVIQDVLDRKGSRWLAGAVVIGIGGSSLGAMAVESAVNPKTKNIYIETTDPDSMGIAIEKIQKNLFEGLYYVYLVISKSGATTETIANFGALAEELRDIDKSFDDHVIAVTDIDSPLHKYARKRNYPVLEVPKNVGGRFSVFSSVGILPLMFGGVDITRMLNGARYMNDLCLTNNKISKNPAAMLAAVSSLNLKKKRHIGNLFIFSPMLENFGKFVRQLIGESLGKDGKGITPLVSIGTTDLHSMGQLYFGGPKDKFTTFINVKKYFRDFKVAKGMKLSNLVKNIEGNSIGGIMQATYKGVKKSYEKHNMPYAEISIDSLSEETMGALLELKMIETIYLAKLMRVNAFDQPAVNHYKEETRKILSKNI